MRRLLFLVFAVAVTSGCSLHATMIPVAGPLSEVRPAPVLNILVKGIMGNSGSLSFDSPTGSPCSGRWSSTAGTATSFGSASLLGAYGPTYISGYSVSTSGGQNPGSALATCADGQTFQLEFVTGSGTAHGYGIGQDNDKNIYRFVF